MKIREILQQEKEMMTPFRRRVNWWILIGYIVWLSLLIIVVPLMIIDENKNAVFMFIWLGLGLVYMGVLIFLNPRIIQKETEIELQGFSYLFTEPKPLEGDSVTIEEEDILYTLTKEGVRVEIPEKVLLQNGEYTGQVFDEVKENVFFLRWADTEIFLATQQQARRVRLALAIFSTDPALEDATLFVPISEKIFYAVKAFGLEERIKDGSWDYLFYNPQDAFKQIITKGRILTMRNKKTGKLFVDKQGNFIGEMPNDEMPNDKE